MSDSEGSKLRVGVVGVGHLGQHHARVYACHPDVELVGVADSRPAQAEEVAARTGTRAFASYLQLRDAVDAVSVAVPTSQHRQIAGAFLEHGIATLIEKPIAGSLLDAEQLTALAETHDAVLQVGHIERFNPALSALEGMALRPRFITAERLSTYTFRSTDIGVVLDLMIHDIDLVLSLVNSPVKTVEAVGVSVFGGHEDMANARVEFEDGCVANFTASRASYQATRKMRLYGSEGYASLDFAAKRGTLIRPSEALRRGELELDGLDMTQPSALKDRVFGTILRVDQVEVEGREPLAAELDDFVRAARRIAPPRVSGAVALRAMQLADRILKSLQAHSWEGIEARIDVDVSQPEPSTTNGHALRGPISWRSRNSTAMNTSS